MGFRAYRVEGFRVSSSGMFFPKWAVGAWGFGSRVLTPVRPLPVVTLNRCKHLLVLPLLKRGFTHDASPGSALAADAHKAYEPNLRPKPSSLKPQKPSK